MSKIKFSNFCAMFLVVVMSAFMLTMLLDIPSVSGDSETYVPDVDTDSGSSDSGSTGGTSGDVSGDVDTDVEYEIKYSSGDAYEIYENATDNLAAARSFKSTYDGSINITSVLIGNASNVASGGRTKYGDGSILINSVNTGKSNTTVQTFYDGKNTITVNDDGDKTVYSKNSYITSMGKVPYDSTDAKMYFNFYVTSKNYTETSLEYLSNGNVQVTIELDTTTSVENYKKTVVYAAEKTVSDLGFGSLIGDVDDPTFDTVRMTYVVDQDDNFVSVTLYDVNTLNIAGAVTTTTSMTEYFNSFDYITPVVPSWV